MFNVKFSEPGVASPLAVSGAMGLALVLGASAVAFSPSAASAIEVAITAISCSATSACVSGTNSSTGPGVAGTSSKGIGVNGLSTSSYGVLGTSTSGVGVKAVSSSSSAIYASNNSSTYPTINASQAGAGPAISGTGKAGAGVYGTASTGPGVSGKSTSDNGNGVLGVLNAANAPGPTAAGVRGEATMNGFGVYASSIDYAGLMATSADDDAIIGNGQAGGYFSGVDGDGVDGFSQNGYGGTFESGTGNASAALVAEGGTTTTSGDAIEATNGNGTEIMYLDNAGNLHLHGQTYTFAACRTGCTASAVRSYAPKESEPTMEDVGSGRLVLGSAYVALDPAFANVVDAKSDYHVLVTPEGDSNGVYVAQRTSRGFLVHENRGGRSTVAFSYRIVAKPYGATEPRLPMEALRRPAAEHLASHTRVRRAAR